MPQAIRVAFASACADAGVFTAIATNSGQRPHSQRGSAAESPSPRPSTEKPIGSATVKNADAGARPAHAANDQSSPQHTRAAG